MRELVLLKYQQKQIATFFCSSKKLIVCYRRVKNRKREDAIFLEVEYKRDVRCTDLSTPIKVPNNKPCVDMAKLPILSLMAAKDVAAQQKRRSGMCPLTSFIQGHSTTILVCVYKAHFKVGSDMSNNIETDNAISGPLVLLLLRRFCNYCYWHC